MAPSIDVILQYEVVGLYGVLFVIVLVDIHEIAALKVRVEDQGAIVLAELGGILALDLREVVEPALGF